MFTITTERAEDGPAIEALLDQAFGPNRKAKISYRYRDGIAPVPDLKLVARDKDERVIGTIRYWPIRIGAKAALLLGPVAIDATRRGEGIGATLVRQTLEMAAWARHRIVLLVGDLPYYRQFGFAPAAPHGVVMPDENPARVLILGLDAGALDGIAGTVRRWRSVRGRGVRRAA